MSFAFEKERLATLEALASRYPSKKALMLPALWQVMEQEGAITDEAIEAVADYLEVPASEVTSVPVSGWRLSSSAPSHGAT